MKRELKFRAWDSDEKRMIYFWLFGTDEGYHIREQRNIEEYDIMQFTGLLDKNEREIYEGDVLAPMSNDLEYNGNWIVDFRDGTFIAKCKNGIDDQWIPYWKSDEEIEVIGNIHENPELLK